MKQTTRSPRADLLKGRKPSLSPSRMKTPRGPPRPASPHGAPSKAPPVEESTLEAVEQVVEPVKETQKNATAMTNPGLKDTVKSNVDKVNTTRPEASQDMELETDNDGEALQFTHPESPGNDWESDKEPVQEPEREEESGEEEMEWDTDSEEDSEDDEEDEEDMHEGDEEKPGVSVKVRTAKSQYEIVKRFYLSTKENMEMILAGTKHTAVASELKIMRKTLKIIRRSLKAKEKHLIEVMSERHPEVVVVEEDLMPIRIRVRDVERKGSIEVQDPATDEGQDLGEVDKTPKEVSDKAPVSKGVETKDNGDKQAQPAPKKAKAVEESSKTKGKSRKQVYKSTEFVAEEDMNDQSKAAPDPAAKEGHPAPPPSGKPPPKEVVRIQDVVKEKRQAEGKKPKAADTRRQMPIDKNSFYHKAKIDLSKVIRRPTAEESKVIHNFEQLIPNAQFKWGPALSFPFRNIVYTWDYEEITEEDKARPEDLRKVVVMLKSMTDGDSMKEYLKTAPRLLQLSVDDPYYTEDAIDWRQVENGTSYPWKPRNAVLKALHGMCSRTDSSPAWTDEPELIKQFDLGIRGLHLCLQESLKEVSLKTTHDDIHIETEGEDGVIPDFVPMSKSMFWLYQQILVKGRPEEEIMKKARNSKNHPHDLSWYQRKIYLAIMAAMMIYENEQYIFKVKRAEKDLSKDDLADLKEKLKSGSCINQVVKVALQKNAKRIEGTAPAKAIDGPHGKEPAEVKVTDDATKKAVSDFRRESLQTLAVLLSFGTAGLFHLWPNYKEHELMEAALLINMSHILVTRRREGMLGSPFGFGARAWNRLDNHVFKILREFIDEDGLFVLDIDWKAMTEKFNAQLETSVVAHLMALDIETELAFPGLTRGLQGQVVPAVKLDSKNDDYVRPSSFQFRSLFGPAEGSRHPVKDRGVGLHPEKDSNGHFTKQDNPTSKRHKDDLRAKDIGARKRTISSVVSSKGKKMKMVNAVSEKDKEVVRSSQLATQGGSAQPVAGPSTTL